MRFYFDLNLGKLVSLPGYSGLLSSAEFKRGDEAVLEVQFCRGSVAQSLGEEFTEMVFVAKLDFLPGTAALLLASVWTHDAITHIYSAPLGQSGDLTTVLGALAYKDMVGEFTFTTVGGGPSTSQTIIARVANDVWKGIEGTPLALTTPEAWLSERQNALLRTSAEGEPLNAVAGVKQSCSINGAGAAAGSVGPVNWEVGSDLGNWSGQITVVAGDTDIQAADKIVASMNANAAMMVHYSAFRSGLLVVVEARVAAAQDADFYMSFEGAYPSDAPLAAGVAPVAGTVAAYLGQWCRVGDASLYDWYRWDGTAWELSPTVPSTASVLGLLQGWAEVPMRIGTEYMPDEFDGNKMFNGQVSLGNQSPAVDESAMNRIMSHKELMFSASCVRTIVSASGFGTSGSGAASSTVGSWTLSGSLLVSAWQRISIMNNLTTNPSWTGGISSAGVPQAYAMVHFVQMATSSNNEARFVVGEVGGGAPTAYGTPRLAGRGFGYAIYYSTTNSRYEVRLFAHNGTTYVESGSVAFIAYEPSSWIHNTIVSSDGMGNIKLFDGVNTAGNMGGKRPSNTPILTLAGGPTSGNLGQPYVSVLIVNGAVAPSGIASWRIMNVMAHVGLAY